MEEKKYHNKSQKELEKNLKEQKLVFAKKDFGLIKQLMAIQELKAIMAKNHFFNYLLS